MTAVDEPKKLRALLLEGISPVARDLLAAEGLEVELLPKALQGDELAAKLEGVHLLGIRSKTHVTREVLARAADLVVLGCFCIGTNQVDLEAAKAGGVPVFNAPFSNTRSVAELILSEVIALSRRLGDFSRDVHLGRWKKSAAGSHEVRGKTLGIVGYGHIGSQVGVLAEAVGMRVLFFDITPKLPMGNNRPVASLPELFGESDFVTLHVPATPQTKEMIGERELAAMRPGACLLNASRGNVVVIPALARALAEMRLAGAAIDVYPEEPGGNSDGFESELRGLSNVILTPHVGGSTEEAQEAIGREVGSSLARFLASGATTHAVNFPQVELPKTPAAHRILNVHQNVPGVLRDINRIVSDANANIEAQVLATDPQVGYLVMDLARHLSAEVHEKVAALPTSIRTRILD